MIRIQAAASVDGNGNMPLLSVTTIGEKPSASIDSLPSIELHSLSICGMTCSSTSDSGCMIESISSTTATVDDEQTVSLFTIQIIFFQFSIFTYFTYLSFSEVIRNIRKWIILITNNISFIRLYIINVRVRNLNILPMLKHIA